MVCECALEREIVLERESASERVCTSERECASERVCFRECVCRFCWHFIVSAEFVHSDRIVHMTADVFADSM